MDEFSLNSYLHEERRKSINTHIMSVLLDIRAHSSKHFNLGDTSTKNNAFPLSMRNLIQSACLDSVRSRWEWVNYRWIRWRVSSSFLLMGKNNSCMLLAEISSSADRKSGVPSSMSQSIEVDKSSSAFALVIIGSWTSEWVTERNVIPSTGVMQLNSSIIGFGRKHLVFRKEKIPIELISFQQVSVLDESLQPVTRKLSTPHDFEIICYLVRWVDLHWFLPRVLPIED